MNQPILEIFAPRQEGDLWIVEAVVRTPFGPLRLRGEGSEALARHALGFVRQKLRNRAMVAGDQLDEVSGFWADLASGVKRVARSKAFGDVLSTAKSVLRNPIFKSIAGQVPIISNVVSASDMAFQLADGIRAGQDPAKLVLGQINALASSNDPNKAAQGQKILKGLEAADQASRILRAALKGSAKARAAIKVIEADAARGVPAARTAFLALDAAKAFQQRTVAAKLATAALNGDTVAEAKIRKLHNDAVNGDKDALAACRSLRAVVINRKRPTQPVPVSDHTPSEYVATAEDEAQADPVDASGGLDAIGLSPRHAKMLDELRAIRLGVRAPLRSGAPESPRRGAPLRRSA